MVLGLVEGAYQVASGEQDTLLPTRCKKVLCNKNMQSSRCSDKNCRDTVHGLRIEAFKATLLTNYVRTKDFHVCRLFRSSVNGSLVLHAAKCPCVAVDCSGTHEAFKPCRAFVAVCSPSSDSSSPPPGKKLNRSNPHARSKRREKRHFRAWIRHGGRLHIVRGHGCHYCDDFCRRGGSVAGDNGRIQDLEAGSSSDKSEHLAKTSSATQSNPPQPKLLGGNPRKALHRPQEGPIHHSKPEAAAAFRAASLPASPPLV